MALHLLPEERPTVPPSKLEDPVELTDRQYTKLRCDELLKLIKRNHRAQSRKLDQVLLLLTK